MTTRKFTGRTLARSQALQILFQADATKRPVADVLAGDYILSQGPLDPFAAELASGAGEMIPALDRVIASASKNWSVGRMPSVDRNLLRLALYEMLEVDEVAVSVTISESVELAKAYGTDESSKFVNGVLGHIASELEAGIDVIAAADEPVSDADEAAAEDPSTGTDAAAPTAGEEE